MSPTSHRDDVVSVVLPVRNRAATVGAAVASVLEGSWVDLELIVVDDASDDGTQDVLASIDDDRLDIVWSSERGGAAQARNVGIARARGSLVAFQDSDDRWTPQHLDVLVAALESATENVAVSYGIVEYETGVTFPGPDDRGAPSDLRTTLARYNVVDLPASIVRADALRSVGGFAPELPRLQDWDLFLRLSRHHRFAFVDEVVLHAGGGNDRISADEQAYYIALQQVLDSNNDVVRLVPDAAVAFRMQLARHHARSGRPVPALRNAAAAARHPRGFGSWFSQRIVGGVSPVERHVGPSRQR